MVRFPSPLETGPGPVTIARENGWRSWNKLSILRRADRLVHLPREGDSLVLRKVAGRWATSWDVARQKVELLSETGWKKEKRGEEK